MIQLSGQAIRGVALGVVVTAIAQTLVGAIGLFVAQVPFAAVLSLVMFLAAAQVGAALVMAIPVFWLYWTDSPGMGTFLLVVTLVVATMDNVLRPILIKKGADLPPVLIFVGVIGGLVSFGLIGIFIGPVVLAVTHTLINSWMDQQRQPAAPEGSASRERTAAAVEARHQRAGHQHQRDAGHHAGRERFAQEQRAPGHAEHGDHEGRRGGCAGRDLAHQPHADPVHEARGDGAQHGQRDHGVRGAVPPPAPWRRPAAGIIAPATCTAAEAGSGS